MSDTIEQAKVRLVHSVFGMSERTFTQELAAYTAAVRAEAQREIAERPPGRCQDCGERTKDRVNHPTGHLCYKCVRERILADSAEAQREAFAAGWDAGFEANDEWVPAEIDNCADAFAAYLRGQP